MTTVELRRRVKRRIDRLSTERLQVAEDFLAYLQERDQDAATEELLRIPDLVQSVRRAERGVAAGKITPVHKLRRKY